MEIAILVLAALLRFWALDIKPAHFDEGINGWFADMMTHDGYYKYDPQNYHGPLHFYAVFLSQSLFGRNLWALRLPAIAASLLAVWVLLQFRGYFGNFTARMSALAMAVSPGFVFYGRYSIHESWQVLFCLIFLWGILGLWQKGDRKSLFAVVLATTGMVLTKETYLLHIGCFVLSGLVLMAWQKVIPSRPAMAVAKQKWKGRDLAWASGIGVLVIIFFYSGNFLDFSILPGLYKTFAAWFKTGVENGGHEKNTYQIIGPINYYWVALMARYEWPALLGLLACVRYVARSDARLRFIAIYAGGSLLAYSLIPYKTPWCVISIIWPFYFLCFGCIGDFLQTRGRWVVINLCAALILISFAFCIRLNFFRFTDSDEPYVYVQTYEDIDVLTGPLLGMANLDKRLYHLNGRINIDSYYPLPWILGDFTGIGYFKEESPPPNLSVDFLVIDQSREPEFEKTLSGGYYKRRFRIRSGQADCTVYFKDSIYGKWFGGPPEIQQ